MKPVGRPPELARPHPTTVLFDEVEFVAFKEACVRQGKSMSELLREFAREYARNHSANDQSKISSFEDPRFIALPTLGEPLSPERIDSMDEETQLDIAQGARRRMDEAIAGLKRRGYGRSALTNIREGRPAE